MPDQAPQQDIDSALAVAHAQAALSQLSFHLTVQQTATAHVEALEGEIRKHLLHAHPAPVSSNLPICPIDLELIESEDVRALACGHVYHAECIGHWLDFSNTCPLDRSVVNPTEEIEDASSNDSGTEDASTNGGSVSTTRVPSNAPSRTSSISSAGSVTIDMGLVENLAFHHRLIAEHEMLVARAEVLVLEGSEIDLNIQWAEFLRTQIGELVDGAVAVECEILGPDEDLDVEGGDAEDEGEAVDV